MFVTCFLSKTIEYFRICLTSHRALPTGRLGGDPSATVDSGPEKTDTVAAPTTSPPSSSPPPPLPYFSGWSTSWLGGSDPPGPDRASTSPDLRAPVLAVTVVGRARARLLPALPPRRC